MSTAVPACMVALFILLWGVVIAHAERRPVVVIDLAGDAPTTELASAVHAELGDHPDLQSIGDPTIPGELVGEFKDDDRDRLIEAQGAKGRAEDQLAKFQFPLAESIAATGLRELELVAPTTNALALYAQLAFARAQAQLGLPRATAVREARESFALAHRLDPAFAPDPVRHLPDVVQAFDAAKVAWSGKASLAITGSGRLWIDGKDAGFAPHEVEIEAGPHVVWLTGPERVTRAAAITLEAGTPATLRIPDAPADARLKVRRARAALRNAPDPAARAAAIKQLAELVGVHDAVLLTSVNGKIVVQTWNAGLGGGPASVSFGAPGFSALRELGKAKPIDLLTPLAPPRKPIAVEPPHEVPIEVPPRRWYERRAVQASIVVGVIAAVVGSVLLYNALTDDTVTLDPNVGLAGRSSP
jgi:hypothetical protein